MKVLLDYLKQASTWRGIIGIATAFGAVLSPEQATAIVGLGVAAIGFIEIIRNEKKEKDVK